MNLKAVEIEFFYPYFEQNSKREKKIMTSKTRILLF
jgi:hypothetical protein